MAINMGSIYAEAELNVDKFTSASGELEVAAAGIAEAMAGCAVRLAELQAGVDGALAGVQRLELPVQIATVLQPVEALDAMDFEELLAGAALQPVSANVPVEVRPTVQSVVPVDAAALSAAMSADAQGISLDMPVAVNLRPEADLSGLAASLTAAGATAAQCFATGIASGAGAAASNASAMASSALRAIGSSTSAAQSIGRMISAGVASGIRSGQSDVVSAAVEMVKAAIRAANAEAEIHSPSRVTAEMGKFWDEGWAVGIEKNTRVATRAAAGMVKQLMSVMGGGMAPDIEEAVRAAVYVEPPAGVAYGASHETSPTVRVNTPAMDYDALADAMDRREVALYLNDRRMAQGMAGATARAQNARNRKIARGYGK